MAIDYILIGKRIKEKRKQAGFTQEVLAEQLDVTVGYISQCERGISKINLKKLSEISEFLGCDLSYFTTGTALGNENYLENELTKKCSKLTPLQKKQVLHFIDILTLELDDLKINSANDNYFIGKS